MKTSDVTLTFFILILFALLFATNILQVGIKRIKDNWPKYRCQPEIMPFAWLFGHNTQENFTYCIQTMSKNYMKYKNQPLHYNMNLLGKTSKELSDSLNSGRAYISNFRGFTSNIVENVFGVFLNILIEFQKLSIQVKDTYGKTTGVLATLTHTLTGSNMSMNSVWSGPPGQTVRALENICFSPETLLQTENNNFISISDISLNTILKNGSKVLAVMKISNEDENGEQYEALYEVNNGENNETIYVTGSHLVFYPPYKHFIKVRDMPESKKSDKKDLVLYCLITSDHTIPIGKWLFHDWEDNNGSISKSLRNLVR